jgi:2-hydroxychromene-2-carboxylate isomerase
MRGSVAAQKLGQLRPYCDLVFDAIWTRDLNMSDPSVFAEVLSAGGLDAAGLLDLIDQDDVKQELKSTTEEAIARGVFGAPSMFIDGTLHFGQDRLDFVEAAAGAY